MQFVVSPQQAYVDGGAPYGPLRLASSTCTCCGKDAAYYSDAGRREIGITGFCEPCFDYTTIHEDDIGDSDDMWVLSVVAMS